MTEDASNSLPNKPSPEQPPQGADLERVLNADMPEIPDFSKSILAQLQSDLENPPPCQYDEDFISTYYDQQFHLEIADSVLLTQRIENFEKHLPACPPCHHTLGQVSVISELYRQFLYRQEEKLLGFDISAKVLSLYQSEPHANKVVEHPATRKSRPWIPVAMGSVAAAMFILMTFNPFAPTSAPMEAASVDVNALENALRADSRDNRMKEAAIPQVNYSVNVLYETPEAYLFSTEEEDRLTEEALLEPNADLSAAIPRQP